MADSNRERDLVLAPNEFAYILDQTKGHIIAYVGPYKTSMANTDQPVMFDEVTKRFKLCNLEQSIKSFTSIPEGWYVTLKNPAKDGRQPNIGTANSSPSLEIGRKVNLPGPAFFALWPGQMVRVIQGHRLRTNQYLIVRVYEEEQAFKNWKNAVIQRQKGDATLTEETKEALIDSEIPDLSVGKMLVIKGSMISFYIPPTGIEVVPDESGNYIRQAVTLERLEYCILLDENGNKRYVKGPDVVIPKPTETFFMKHGLVKFKAIELSDISGIYIKVIAPYEEDGKSYSIGDELFITGKEQMIYYPRVEHALIKYGEREIFHAVAIPPGEGRYYMNRKSGLISLQKGPCMFLPDPREAVIVQRILSPKQCALFYPGNKEVLEYNLKLRELAGSEANDEYVTAMQISQMASKEEKATEKEKLASSKIVAEEFVRKQSFTKPRTVLLDTKYQGAVTIDVWTGYAILVTSKTGNRKEIVGPQTYLLEYDEDLAVIELSTGTPKTDANLIRTVYLRVLHNKVSDIVNVETKDLCPASISLSYRVNFEGEPEKWFNVENYVKFLTEHLRSVIRNAVKKITIKEFYSNGIDISRDTILGVADETGSRNRGRFIENGMHIYDVEIFEISILDEDIHELLFEAQHSEVKQNIEINTQQLNFKFTTETENISRKILEEKSSTLIKKFDLEKTETEKGLLLSLAKLDSKIKQKQAELDGKIEESLRFKTLNINKIDRIKSKQDMRIEFSQKMLNVEIKRIETEVSAMVNKAKAISPDFIAALQAFSDRALAQKLAESMAPMSILGGKSVADVFRSMLHGTVLENVLNKAPKNNSFDNELIDDQTEENV